MIATAAEVAQLAAMKYGDPPQGWGPRLRASFGYYTPDDWYEATLCDLVKPHTRWLDIGCGRTLFPSNHATAQMLADRCQSLTGLDPGDNIDVNPYVHHRVKCRLEDYRPEERFDLITLRMVVEHITDPDRAAAALGRLCQGSGQVVIYTVDKWSPASMVSAVTPIGFHHRVKSMLWQSEERDTFETAYLMNTRRRLHDLLRVDGFAEEDFRTLADTRSTMRFKALNTVELTLWRSLRAVGLDYPEKCLLGIYRKMH